MGKRTLQIEWTIAEEENSWQTLSAASDTNAPAHAHPLRPAADQAERRLAALVVLVGLLMAGAWMWQRQSAQVLLARQLQATVAQEIKAQQEAQASATQPNQLLTSAIGPVMPVHAYAGAAPGLSTALSLPDVQIHDYELVGERIMAQVIVSSLDADGQVSAHRETHFYRQKAGEWQRIEPDPALLGPWQTLRAPYFTLRHRAIDAGPVAQTAPRLDRLYERLRRDVGLPAASTSPAILVELSDAKQANAFSLMEHAIVVASPALLSAPTEMEASEVLYQALVYPLAGLVVDEVVNQYPPSRDGGAASWWPLLNALPLWAVWEDGGALAAGQADVRRWLVHNAQVSTPVARQPVPHGYARLCQTYGIWNLAPAAVSIPLSCTEADQAWPQPMAPALPLRLDALVPAGTRPDSGAPAPIFGSQIVALETVVEYVVATYGRAALPRLVAALGSHTTWNSLLHEVFGASAAEFEAGWQGYLRAEYGDTTQPAPMPAES